ncbi:MAG: hypothetical protein JWP71_2411 [Mucilaginibacter sp.]|nr:hypothetical protein [Mucilaginibacter sp.]
MLNINLSAALKQDVINITKPATHRANGLFIIIIVWRNILSNGLFCLNSYKIKYGI